MELYSFQDTFIYTTSPLGGKQDCNYHPHFADHKTEANGIEVSPCIHKAYQDRTRIRTEMLWLQAQCFFHCLSDTYSPKYILAPSNENVKEKKNGASNLIFLYWFAAVTTDMGYCPSYNTGATEARRLSPSTECPLDCPTQWAPKSTFMFFTLPGTHNFLLFIDTSLWHSSIIPPPNSLTYRLLEN